MGTAEAEVVRSHIGIRIATPEDLPRLAACAEEFYAASKFLRGFNLDRFSQFWTGAIQGGQGVVILLVKGDGIVGTLGGFKYTEPYSGDLIATEFFWYVLEDHRCGGIRLYDAFEQWAKEQGCSEVRMIHLQDVMPDKMERFYLKRGFTPCEVHYQKVL